MIPLTKLASQIGLVWIDHIWYRNCHDNSYECLDCGCKGDRFASDSGRRAFAQNHKADRPDGKIVDEVPDHQQR
jgi:hypothetical protein